MMISNQKSQAIQTLDLEPIKAKLMHLESGEGWSQTKAATVEKEYRRFLYLVIAFPHEQLNPLRDVDTFWHYHILDTMKYRGDCEAVFGYFLDHFPYLGIREEDEPLHQEAGERIRVLYEETFDTSYAEAAHAMAQADHPESTISLAIGSGPAQSTGSAYSMSIGATPEKSMESAYSMSIGTRPLQPIGSAYSMSIAAAPRKSMASAYSMSIRVKPAKSIESAYSMSVGLNPEKSMRSAYSMSTGVKRGKSLDSAYSMSIGVKPEKSMGVMAA